MNWYFVQNGSVLLRAPDRVPDEFEHPTLGKLTNLSAASPAELAVIGWLQGEESETPEFDPLVEKCYVRPQAPAGLQEYAAEVNAIARAALAAAALGKAEPAQVEPPPAPRVLEQAVIEPLSDAELDQLRDQAFRQIRSRRDMLLLMTDRFFLTDAPPMPADDVAELKAFRQALRDLPQKTPDPRGVAWPLLPRFLKL